LYTWKFWSLNSTRNSCPELVYALWAMSEVFDRFPLVVSGWISCPFDPIEHSTSSPLICDDLLNLVFLNAAYNCRFRKSFSATVCGSRYDFSFSFTSDMWTMGHVRGQQYLQRFTNEILVAAVLLQLTSSAEARVSQEKARATYAAPVASIVLHTTWLRIYP